MNLLCHYCHSTAKFCCGRCKVENYCSKTCQKKAFSQHRFHCSVLPPLFPIDSDCNELSEKVSKIHFSTNNWTITAERKIPQIKEKHTVRFESVKKSTELDLTKLCTSLLESPKVLNDSISTNSSSKTFNIPLPNPPLNRPIIYSDLRLRVLTPGRHPIIISHYNPSKNMFCVMENSDELGKFLKAVARAVKKCEKNKFPPDYEPKYEEMVLAQYKGTFYRACVIDKVGQDYIVLFVDFGNQAPVQIYQMKPFHKLLMMDLITNDVYFRNIPVPLTKKAKNILRTENGIEIDVMEERTAEGWYIADLIGL